MIHWNLQPDTLPECLKHCAAAIGNFDGVHRGHAEVVRRLRTYGRPTAVFTFSPHPRQILHPENAPDLLTWTERKVELLKALGVDEIIVCPTEKILSWEAETFFQRVVVQLLDADVLVEGPNFHFGNGRGGDTQLLGSLCMNSGRILEVVESLQEHNGEPVSSSRIREHLQRGEITEANALLTAPYRIRGTVIHGLARGRTMGFPTANLGNVGTLIPSDGVYACRAILPGVPPLPAAVHIGPNVTFHESGRKIEVHLIDFHETLYDEWMEVEFAARLRDLAAFPTREELMTQIQCDIQSVKEILSRNEAEAL